MSVKIISGDCFARMSEMLPDSIDAIVTDPPYGLQFMGKEWDKLWRNETPADAAYVERTKGELTSRARKLPDYSATNPQQMQEWFRGFAVQALRVLKPGGHMVAFGAPKNAHRLTCAIEDAGFEIRDVLMWVFGTGFPKSHNLDGDREGWGTALKPAYEPIILARKPLVGTVAANVDAFGTGALNIDACRVEHQSEADRASATPQGRTTAKVGALAGGVQHDGDRSEFDRPDTSKGRWPANLMHDGSDEVLAAFPEAPGQQGALTGNEPSPTFSGDVIYGKMARSRASTPRGDAGSAARFFYCAKAGKADRAGSKHPTVKPIALMRWLVRLITPPGGVVLDPFAGSGTTGAAAEAEGFDAILIEREAEYLADIRRRVGAPSPALEELLA